MLRHGALLVFKPGVSLADAEKALKRIESVIDPDYFIPLRSPYATTWGPRGTQPLTRTPRLPVVAADGDKVLTHIESYDDTYGGPVFYIP